MPNCLNLNVAMRYDFIVTYLAIMFFIYWVLARIRIMRLSHAFRLVWLSRNRKIHFNLRRVNQKEINPYPTRGLIQC